MTASTDGYQIRPLIIELAHIPFLDVVQIQPTLVDLANNDYSQRSKLLSLIINWVTTDHDANIVGGQPQPAGVFAKRPRRPFLLCFPELYVPLRLLLNLASSGILEEGSIIMGGICPLEETGSASSMFGQEQLLTLRTALQEHSDISVLNLYLIDELIAHVKSYGNLANLAATLAIDKNRCAKVVFHSKLAPSKFERGLTNELTTLEGMYLNPIVLTAGNGINRQITILPMICSDLFLWMSGSGQQIIPHYNNHGSCPIVDLVSVMCIQKTNPPTYMHPYPSEITRMLLGLAAGSFQNSFQHAHVLWTNVDRWIESGRTEPVLGGYSHFCIKGPSISNIKWIPSWLGHWSGPVFLYGQVLDGNQGLQEEKWFRSEHIGKNIKMEKAPTAIILTPGLLTLNDEFKIQASGQHMRFNLSKSVGPEAIGSGQVLLFKDDVFSVNTRVS